MDTRPPTEISPHVGRFLAASKFPRSGGLESVALLSGRELSPGERTGHYMPFNVMFEKGLRARHQELTEADHDEINEGLGEIFTPIATVGRGLAALLASASGHYILCGICEPGILYVANDLAMALTRLSHGYPSAALIPDPMSPIFDYDQLDETTIITFPRGHFLEALP